ncbi:MAG: thioredoxin domain-containing protein [Clostridia bacterium]|nr:thioredoxin domain-containing protein [Clostridia bacterium]
MTKETVKTANRLIHEQSPYLLQHAYNPVNWYPWGEEAFNKAQLEDKPVFVSIGYSTCHWCHVMAHESFEDETVAELLNRDFICIKVDKEERPDIDSVYMRACQAINGNGGWPMSIFATADGKPFYAGTYFPKPSFIRLLGVITNSWQLDRATLLKSRDQLTAAISQNYEKQNTAKEAPIEKAVAIFKNTFDKEYGGFGSAPKFPSPHNLMFLLSTAPDLAEKTLLQMYRGGIFDHIGGGFSRYSTDRYWLAPHFEKMLYDNALLAMAYLLAFEKTANELYKRVAEKVFLYLEREMRNPNGGFFSAQDADSDGVEGKYYLFEPNELVELLGKEDGEHFCRHYDITAKGNFEGKNIPNLLVKPEHDSELEAFLPKVYEYRKTRTALHTDSKLLTAWNSLTAAAYAMAAQILKDNSYLQKAREIITFIENELTDGDIIYVGKSGGKRSARGFLDDYAFYIFALIQMHQASQEDTYLQRAKELAEKTVSSFWDSESGGFFFSGTENETLVSRPKETYDGAIPSGNSVMAYNLQRLAMLTEDQQLEKWSELQNSFMNGQAAAYPSGYGFYLYSVLPVKKIVCSLKDKNDLREIKIKSDWVFRVTDNPQYPLVNEQTTYYVCKEGTCLPPTNELSQALD